MTEKIAGAILAGVQSRRMGGDGKSPLTTGDLARAERLLQSMEP